LGTFVWPERSSRFVRERSGRSRSLERDPRLGIPEIAKAIDFEVHHETLAAICAIARVTSSKSSGNNSRLLFSSCCLYRPRIPRSPPPSFPASSVLHANETDCICMDRHIASAVFAKLERAGLGDGDFWHVSTAPNRPRTVNLRIFSIPRGRALVVDLFLAEQVGDG